MLHSVSVIRPSQLSFDIQARWRAALAAQQNWASPFLTPEFTFAVAEEREDARIILARDHQGLLGILCIHQRPGGYARPVGAPVADHQAFITEPDFSGDLAQVLQAAGFSALCFNVLNDAQGRHGALVNHQHSSLLATLPDGPEAYFAVQEKQHHRYFKKMRQRTRGAERDHGARVLKLDCHDQAAFDHLLRWKRAQYWRTRKCDVLASHWVEGLLETLWKSHGRMRAVLSVLELGGKPAAAEIGLLCQGTYHSWIAAYNPALSRCSPGIMLMEGILRRAGELGITTMDMGAGHAHYKKYYANASIALGQGKVLGYGVAAQRQRLIDGYGTRLLAGMPARLAHSLEFMAACHPLWPDRLRGFAQRLGHTVV